MSKETVLIIVSVLLGIIAISGFFKGFNTKSVLNFFLIGAVIALIWFIVYSIYEPIDFNRVKNKRYDATIEKLIDIREAQEAYKSQKGYFTGSFDTLINFVENDSFEISYTVGPYDSLLDAGWTKLQAYRSGLVRDVKSYVQVQDSLFSDNYPVDSLRYVPFTDTATFRMAAGEIETASKVKVKVFEAKVHNDVLLHGLDEQLVINENDEREKIAGYPGLKVGDLEEATNNAGNWE